VSGEVVRVNNLKPKKIQKVKGKGGGARANAMLLEQAVRPLIGYGFVVYNNYNDFLGAIRPVDRYVVIQFNYKTRQGTTGRKDAVIVVRDCRGDGFVRDDDGFIRIVLEMKFEETQGTTYQKLPLEYWGFQESEIPNWIIIYEGKKWSQAAPRSVLDLVMAHWEKDKKDYPNKSLRVVTQDEFYALVGRCWGIVPEPPGEPSQHSESLVSSLKIDVLKDQGSLPL
jgi:hypothetical protein